MTCTGCDLSGSELCAATFVCVVCSKRRSVCSDLPGGMGMFWGQREDECVVCKEKRTLGVKWSTKWHRNKGAGG